MRALFSLLMLLVFLAPQLHAEPVVVPGAKDATDLPWASDGEANVPYVFHDPAHESRITGFEKDLVDDKNIPIVSSSKGIEQSNNVVTAPTVATNTIDMAAFTLPTMASTAAGALSVASTTVRRPLLRDNSFRIPSPIMQPRGGSACGMSSAALDWELNGLRSSPGLHFSAPRTTQAIPGCMDLVKVRNSNALSLSFATEGHEDGQVSRPWGLCVDKMGHVLVSDRRNNRVQVFNPDGSLKFKFGRKGVGNGEFPFSSSQSSSLYVISKIKLHFIGIYGVFPFYAEFLCFLTTLVVGVFLINYNYALHL